MTGEQWHGLKIRRRNQMAKALGIPTDQFEQLPHNSIENNAVNDWLTGFNSTEGLEERVRGKYVKHEIQ